MTIRKSERPTAGASRSQGTIQLGSRNRSAARARPTLVTAIGLLSRQELIHVGRGGIEVGRGGIERRFRRGLARDGLLYRRGHLFGDPRVLRRGRPEVRHPIGGRGHVEVGGSGQAVSVMVDDLAGEIPEAAATPPARTRAPRIKRLFIRSSFGSNSTAPQTVAAVIAILERRMGTVKRNGLWTAGPYPVRF